MGNKNKKEQQLNIKIKQLNELIAMFVGLCEEYQRGHNGFRLGEEEENLYVEKIFSYYTFIAFKIDDLKKIKNNNEIDSLIANYNEKISYVKSLLIIKNNKEVNFGSILKDRVDRDINGESSGGVRVLKLKLTPSSLKQEIFETFISVILSLLVIVSLSGFFPWGNWTSIFDLVKFTLCFLGLKLLLKYMFLIFGKKLIFKTMGIIMILPFIISLVLACIFPIFFEIEKYFTFIIIALANEAIKKFIFDYFNDKKLQKKMIRIMGDE